MTTSTSPVLESLLAAANPVSPQGASEWATSPAAERALHRALTENVPMPRFALRRVLMASALGFAALITAGGVALAAVRVLGGPPAQVRHDISAVDQGMPADLRYHPDVRNARSVAETAGSALYAADLPDGGYCSELVLSGRAAGAVCTSAASLRAHPIQVTVPLPATASAAPPITMGGRVALEAAVAVVVRYGDGGSDRARLQAGYYVLNVPVAHRASAYAAAFTVTAIDATGRVLGSVIVPAAADTPPPPAPIEATTISDSADFTLVLGVDGQVSAPGVTSLALRLPDGHEIAVPLRADGSFHLELPAGLQRAFATQRGVLVARDRSGRTVASTAIEAVAAARAAGM